METSDKEAKHLSSLTKSYYNIISNTNKGVIKVPQGLNDPGKRRERVTKTKSTRQHITTSLFSFFFFNEVFILSFYALK